MDGIIVYGSKYGTTRRYAEELSRLTGLSAIPCREFQGMAGGTPSSIWEPSMPAACWGSSRQ